jgi:adenosylhomocysteine nucleosidase
MDEEVAQIVGEMQVEELYERACMKFYKGKLEQRDVVIVRSGIGKVNAAVCTQILCDHFGVDGVVNTGIAGSLKNEINIGDVVLSTDVLHHDMDATGFGYPLGQIPRMDTLAFQADERLTALAEKACKKVAPEIGVHLGRVVSGDQFISDQDVKDRILKNFDGYCTEMEGAAIAQTAYLNGVPFLILRAISDKADNSATMDYPAFEAMAIANSVKILKEMVASL